METREPVRMVDDLGRVAIPKEIRGVMHINEGDALEFHVQGKDLLLSFK